jgi:hypothetical protein
VYLDDNAVRFEGWDGISADGSSLPISAESRFVTQKNGAARDRS